MLFRSHLVHCTSAVISSLGRWSALGERPESLAYSTVGAECDTVAVVKSNDESALMTGIMAQELLARVVMSTTYLCLIVESAANVRRLRSLISALTLGQTRSHPPV